MQNSNKVLVVSTTLLVISVLLLAPGIISYIKKYNAMEQELNRIGAYRSESNIPSTIKSSLNQPKAQTINQIKTTTTTSKPNTKTTVEKIDYKPLENAIDAAIGVEELDSKDSPFSLPDDIKVVQPPKPDKLEPKQPITHQVKNIKSQPQSQKIIKVHRISKNSKPIKTSIYAVQLASFKNKKSAIILKDKLSKNNSKAIIQKHKNIYRVFALSINGTKAEATRLNKAILTKYKINGYIKKITA